MMKLIHRKGVLAMKHLHKRLFAALTGAALCGTLLTGLLPLGTLTASALDYGPLKYKDYGDHIEILSCEKDVTELVIPEEIDGVPVTKIGPYLCKENKKLEKVILPDSVQSIGDGAFAYCTALVNLELGNGLTSLGQSFGGNFRGCTSLKKLRLPASLQEISCDAFNNCTALETLIIENGIKSINSRAFDSCIALQEVIIPDSVTKIGVEAFRACNGIKKISLGNGITRIESSAFYDCSLISEITFGNQLEYLGTSAFSYTAISKIVLPSSVKRIEGNVFALCPNLSSITILNPDCYINPYSQIAYNEIDKAGNKYYNGVIYGFTGSTTEQHAHSYGCKFISLNNGDINCDGDTNLIDGVMLARIAAGYEQSNLTPEGRLRAELDGEEGLSNGDLVILLQILAGA